MAQTWNCPACHTSIRSGQDREQDPSVGLVYRCHRCRLELVFDPALRMLTVKSAERPARTGLRLGEPQASRRTPTRPGEIRNDE